MVFFRKQIKQGIADIIREGTCGYPEKIFFEFLFHFVDRSIQNFLTFIDQDDMIADFFHLLHPVGAENNGSSLFEPA